MLLPLTLSEVQFNTPVGLKGDDDFLGFVTGRLADDEGGAVRVVVTISQSGKSGKRGCKPFALAELVPARMQTKARGQVRNDTDTARVA